RKRAWARAAQGVLLHAVGQWLFAGAFALITLLLVFILMAMATRSLQFFQFVGEFGKILFYGEVLLILGSQVLNVVGFSFTVTSPGKKGDQGLAIATLAVAGISLICFVYILVKLFDLADFAAMGSLFLGQIMVNPFVGIEGTQGLGGGAAGVGFVVFLMPVLG